MGTVVIRLECAPSGLRGKLSLWMIEISSGVYIGDINCRIRTRLWRRILSELGDGRATMAWYTQHRLHACNRNGKKSVAGQAGMLLMSSPLKPKDNPSVKQI